VLVVRREGSREADDGRVGDAGAGAVQVDHLWLKFCRIKELHELGSSRFLLGIYDLRLDKMVILSFQSGLEREDWFQAMLGVQDTIKKGLVPVKTFGKTAEEQEEQAKQILAEQRRLGLHAASEYVSKYSDEERCQMVAAYSDELDENYGLNNYEFIIVLPYQFPGKPKSWVEKRRASQRELIRALRLEHLVCRIIKVLP
jgi:hypothetical protein